MSAGTNIERIEANNEIINDNNGDLSTLKTLIENLPDTSTATAQAKDIVLGKTAYANGQLVEGTCDWQNIEWQPQPDWWDIKKIVEEDEEDYPMKIIALHDQGAKTLQWQWTNGTELKKIKFSDGQEITSSQLITIGENGIKPCSKGYKTFYSIWYFDNIPNISGFTIGSFFRNSRYIYFYNIEEIYVSQSFYWMDGNNRNIEAIESNKKLTVLGSGNFIFSTYCGFCIHKLPDYKYNRTQTNALPNVFSFRFSNNYNYNDILKIIKNRNFTVTSGQMPTIEYAFINENIDFENDWNIDTTLFTKTNTLVGPHSVQKLNFINVTNATTGNTNFVEIYEVANIKVNISWFNNSLLSHDSIIRVLNALYDYSQSEDTYTITIGTVNLAKLTNEEKAIATRKRLDTSIDK